MTPQHRYNIIAHDGLCGTFYCIAQVAFYNCGVNHANAEAMKVVEALGACAASLVEDQQTDEAA
jgi:hypothetical protein|tara:strand:+ start:58 stop:249 length:192 start_codon:yes stop_codon:yes gene_type:complete